MASVYCKRCVPFPKATWDSTWFEHLCFISSARQGEHSGSPHCTQGFSTSPLSEFTPQTPQFQPWVSCEARKVASSWWISVLSSRNKVKGGGASQRSCCHSLQVAALKSWSSNSEPNWFLPEIAHPNLRKNEPTAVTPTCPPYHDRDPPTSPQSPCRGFLLPPLTGKPIRAPGSNRLPGAAPPARRRLIPGPHGGPQGHCAGRRSSRAPNSRRSPGGAPRWDEACAATSRSWPKASEAMTKLNKFIRRHSAALVDGIKCSTLGG